jgi:lipopolysaccharide transport system permease protein
MSEEIILEAGKTEKSYWRDLWRYRELFLFLAWRDILVRYKQTVIGVLWALVRPLITMVIFTVVFGKIAGLSKEGLPYALLVFSALLPWQFFANTFSESSNSLIGNAGMISKVYFPRLTIPMSSAVVGLVDFAVSFVILAGLMAWYRWIPPLSICFLPLFIFAALVLALGGGIWVAALTVRYRDFRFITPFVVQMGLYVSPVGFSSDTIPEKWRLLYSLNPMVGVIDGFRWSILGNVAPIYWPSFFASVMLSVLILWTGIRYFRSTEKTFADVI